MNYRKITSVFLLIYLLLFFTPKIYAVHLSLSDVPAAITADSFSFTVYISGAKAATTNYLKVDLYKEGTTHYFGYTQNGASYYNGGDYSQFPQVIIDENGSASALLTARVDSLSSYYEGSGLYSIRVRRYTGSGAYSSSEANESATNITISAPTPTPSAAPNPTTTLKITHVSQNSITTSPTIPQKPSNAEADNNDVTKISSGGQVLGTQIHFATQTPTILKNTPSPTKRVLIKGKSVNTSIFIYAGLGILVICAILLFLKYRKDEKNDF